MMVPWPHSQMFLVIAYRSPWAKMARLQSSLLLRRDHGNASKADPDAAAPYPEFRQLLLSADTTIQTQQEKKKRKSHSQRIKKVSRLNHTATTNSRPVGANDG